MLRAGQADAFALGRRTAVVLPLATARGQEAGLFRPGGT